MPDAVPEDHPLAELTAVDVHCAMEAVASTVTDRDDTAEVDGDTVGDLDARAFVTDELADVDGERDARTELDTLREMAGESDDDGLPDGDGDAAIVSVNDERGVVDFDAATVPDGALGVSDGGADDVSTADARLVSDDVSDAVRDTDVDKVRDSRAEPVTDADADGRADRLTLTLPIPDTLADGDALRDGEFVVLAVTTPTVELAHALERTVPLTDAEFVREPTVLPDTAGEADVVGDPAFADALVTTDAVTLAVEVVDDRGSAENSAEREADPLALVPTDGDTVGVPDAVDVNDTVVAVVELACADNDVDAVTDAVVDTVTVAMDGDTAAVRVPSFTHAADAVARQPDAVPVADTHALNVGVTVTRATLADGDADASFELLPTALVAVAPHKLDALGLPDDENSALKVVVCVARVAAALPERERTVDGVSDVRADDDRVAFDERVGGPRDPLVVTVAVPPSRDGDAVELPLADTDTDADGDTDADADVESDALGDVLSLGDVDTVGV